MALCIRVKAYVRPERHDPSAEALFTNGHRAGQYAQMLADEGTYVLVLLIDTSGVQWPILPQKAAV